MPHNARKEPRALIIMDIMEWNALRGLRRQTSRAQAVHSHSALPFPRPNVSIKTQSNDFSDGRGKVRTRGARAPTGAVKMVEAGPLPRAEQPHGFAPWG